MSAQLDCKWKAIQNELPPGPGTLTVTGECTTPTPGYEITLKEAAPQGFNHQILLLEMEVTPPKGIHPQHVTTTSTKFETKTSHKYTEVDIDHGAIRIKVEIVS
jgi:hypothetical protein